MNISYTKVGDYLLPDLILEDKERFNIGKYGLLRLNYMKKEKLGLYFDLLVSDKLNEYLHEAVIPKPVDSKKKLPVRKGFRSKGDGKK